METDTRSMNIDATLIEISRYMRSAEIAQAQPEASSTASQLFGAHGGETARNQARQEVARTMHRLHLAQSAEGLLSRSARSERRELLRWLLALKQIEYERSLDRSDIG